MLHRMPQRVRVSAVPAAYAALSLGASAGADWSQSFRVDPAAGTVVPVTIPQQSYPRPGDLWSVAVGDRIVSARSNWTGDIWRGTSAADGRTLWERRVPHVEVRYTGVPFG